VAVCNGEEGKSILGGQRAGRDGASDGRGVKKAASNGALVRSKKR
jgi:hypothetical protein